jgi:succinate dehydrogenase / fumarate reductase flavoprotein subunit
MELAPRDIVARSIETEIREGRGFAGGYVHLDLRHLGKQKIHKRLPGIREICLDFGGIDPVDEPIPIQPAQHYSMGGIACDATGRTEIPNFYAAGECAAVSVHGANRLGGNSLLETLVFGRLAAEAIRARLDEDLPAPNARLVEQRTRDELARVERLRRTGTVPHQEIRNALHAVMSTQVGVFRHARELTDAVHRIAALREQYQQVRLVTPPQPYNFEIVNVLELEGQLYLGEITARGALARTESRGAHFRTDYPARDDARWLRHTLARLEAGQVRLSYAEVDASLHAPAARTY